jgi:hypothetical protein
MTPADPTTPNLNHPSTAVSPTGLLAEPTFEECHAEWVQYHEDLNARRLHLREVPQGHHLAYYSGRIVDHDEDPNALRERVAASLGIHPARLVICYPWMW